MRYRVALEGAIVVHAESADDARLEAYQAITESLDLLVVEEDRDRSAELYEQERRRSEGLG